MSNPTDRRGNKQLVAISVMNIFIYVLTKVYYIWRNKQRDAKWNALTKEVSRRPLPSCRSFPDEQEEKN